MPEYMTPSTLTVNLKDGTIPHAALVVSRHLSDMRGFYADQQAEAALLAEDPLIYQVFYGAENPDDVGQLRYCTTVIYPGKVGDEYFMTKGHYHARPDRAEVYYGLQGEGCLVLQTPEGEVNVQRMGPGVIAYVPPFWGHRTVNTGTDNFAFLAVWPADAGYNYGAIAEQGFASILVEREGKVAVVPNPRYKS